MPLVSIIMIDSRSDKHPDWVLGAIESAESQNINVELIVVPNIGRKRTIGECWNLGVAQAKADWVLFLGDDDFISFDLCETLLRWANSNKSVNSRIVNVTSYMTAFEDETGIKTALARQHTGMWQKDYLLQHPFNEELKSGIDREYIEETVKRGDLFIIIEYYFGYFYRKHNDYSCAGDIIFVQKPADYFFATSNRQFLNPITDRFQEKVGPDNIIVSTQLSPEFMDNAKVIFVEWANERAIQVANYPCNAKKILRLHAYEAFTDIIKNIDLNKFDTVIFVSDYIKRYVEKQFGKVNGAVVIPNGVEISKFTFDKNKIRNNKIAYAGYLTRKKGIGELLLIAESLPEYEFHIAGRYQEDDVCDYININKPNNVFIHPWQYDINEWFQDKTFILNTSLRESQAMTVLEGMACGLKPIVRNWIDSDEIYGNQYIFKSIDDIKSILEGPYHPHAYRSFVETCFDMEDLYSDIERVLLQTEEKLS